MIHLGPSNNIFYHYHNPIPMASKSDTLRINIYKSSTKFIEGLFLYINECTQFSHVVHNNRAYYEMSNTWGSPPKKSQRPKHDPDIKCDEYMDPDKCAGRPTIWPKNSDTLKYKIKYLGEDCLDEKLFTDAKIDIKPIEQLMRYNPRKVILHGFDNLYLKSSNRASDDHRGSNHCKVFLDFMTEKSTDAPIRLHDLVLSFYEFKQNKWNKWYELFCGVSIKKKNGDLTLTFAYDHGS